MIRRNANRTRHSHCSVPNEPYSRELVIRLGALPHVLAETLHPVVLEGVRACATDFPKGRSDLSLRTHAWGHIAHGEIADPALDECLTQRLAAFHASPLLDSVNLHVAVERSPLP